MKYLIGVLVSLSFAAHSEPQREINLRKKECSRAGVRDYDQSGALVPCAFLYKTTMDNLVAQGKDLSASFISRSNFRKSRWSGSTLSGVDAWASNFEGAVFENSKMEFADFSLVNLRGATFTDIQMQNAFFRSSRLSDAIFRNVDLRMGMLEGADLENATLENVNLKGANLAGAKLTGAKLIEVVWDNGTEWPAGYKPESQQRPTARAWVLITAMVVALVGALYWRARRRS